MSMTEYDALKCYIMAERNNVQMLSQLNQIHLREIWRTATEDRPTFAV